LHVIHSCKGDRKLTITTCNRPLSIALMFSFNSSSVPGLFVRNLAVSCLQRKWQSTERLGELADQALLPKPKMTRRGKIWLSHNPSNHCCVCCGTVVMKDETTVTIDVISNHFSRLQHCSISCWGYGHCTAIVLKEITGTCFIPGRPIRRCD